MKLQTRASKVRLRRRKFFTFARARCWLILLILFSGCSELKKPQSEPFYAQTAPPLRQEFRWSNGKMPKSFDPALAAAPPETDVVRAIFDGLTDTDSKTLRAVPAIAKDWKTSGDKKIWTFNLRKDARWSNGERVTAQDFVRSWKRLAEMRETVAHYELLSNIVGVQAPTKETAPKKEDSELDVLSKKLMPGNLQLFPKPSETISANVLQNSETATPENGKNSNSAVKSLPKTKSGEKNELKFGVEAIDNFTLKVSLVKPDKDFPALVAHPIFRPVYGDGKQFETGKLNADIVTNGAFRVFSVGQDGITLDRAEHYWNREAVELERVRLVPTESAEKALEAYRAGEIDAVTNADFAPLALKLLTPYDDFRRTPHSALNFYEFNLDREPFADRRVREALAIAIERERLTEDDLDGASLPALSFLPFDQSERQTKFVPDADRAKNLLSEAGFPEGQNFPPVKLLVNRNNVQQKIARSVAKMWKQTLNVETEIVVKDAAEIETAGQIGDFDLIRRGVVLATTDEAVNMSIIFPPRRKLKTEDAAQDTLVEKDGEPNQTIENSEDAPDAFGQTNQAETSSDPIPSEENAAIGNLDEDDFSGLALTDGEAVNQVRAIPLYFPTSYSLVKSYVQGFEINILDAPSLKSVRINNDGQSKTTRVQ